MEEKVVKIEKVVFSGKGLSRDLEKVTFVPLTLPGETVRVRITKDHPDYFEAEAISIETPSGDRVAPACPYFGICGGCQMSHATYTRQVAIKRQILEETLRRNQVPFPQIELHVGKDFGYRHRAQLKYDSRNRRLGFFEAGSNQVVDIQECICLTPGLNHLLRKLRSDLCSTQISSLKEIECYENDRGETAAYFLPEQPWPQFAQYKNPDLTISFRQFRYPMHPRIFLQVNPGMWKTMIQEVEGHYSEKNLNFALELYCGSGFFTAPLSARFAKMIACEENAEAVEYARTSHHLSNVQWVRAKAEDFLFPASPDAVIVDPPRAGLHHRVLQQLLKNQPAWITYISCDCTTFSRDIKKLKEFYEIQRITLLDLFPQTFHFETIALLEKRRQS
jgi:23S rRNA (uracil1939-C5)-methyltransferase